MFELFCPEHGLPAVIMWFVFGCDLTIFRLTFQMYYARVYNGFDDVCRAFARTIGTAHEKQEEVKYGQPNTHGSTTNPARNRHLG
jgi:hypothetical protein